MKKIYWLGLLAGASVILTGCVKPGEPADSTKTEAVKEQAVAGEKVGQCQSEAVAIEGYGDKGKKLSNCFVEYPGEPTRQDKSYYVVEDVCGQFTKEFIQNALGKPVVKTEGPKFDGLFNCSYFTNDTNYVMLVFEYLKIDIQKKGQEEMGRITKEEARIPMRNLVVYQEDGMINTIYLVLGEEKFISIQRSSGLGLTTDELINFAVNIAEGIKNYK